MLITYQLQLSRLVVQTTQMNLKNVIYFLPLKLEIQKQN